MAENPTPPIGDVAALALANAETMQRVVVEIIGLTYITRATLADLATSDPALIDRVRESLQADMAQHGPQFLDAALMLLDSISNPAVWPAATLQ